ncbi:MAG: c-type cytochrome [Wenzhouxiangellaceae bacterium]|nr:c-type cytochrome [Wenzhouxiangellaceae bacterium]
MVFAFRRTLVASLVLIALLSISPTMAQSVTSQASATQDSNHAPDKEPSGDNLFRTKGCSGCHAIAAQGGQVGPKLDAVGDRYSAEWLYKWLKDPAAVKPGTTMPDMHLTDNERALLVFYLVGLRSGTQQPPPVATTASGEIKVNPPDLSPESPENAYLGLGVGHSYDEQQRGTLQDQIQAFIPPLFEPAFTESAFVLPPGAIRTQTAYRNVSTIRENDLSGQREIGARFADFKVERDLLDFDFLFGLPNNFTLRINVPLLFTETSSELKPGFFEPVSVFPQGSSNAFGDVSLLLKKKFVDQGNFPIGIAGVAGLRLPTGSNDERFDPRTTVNIGGQDMLLPLPAAGSDGMPIPGTADGTFRRFSNDGRLPPSLQPGIGTVGGTFGLFATRQFEGGTWMGRGALHAGGSYEIRPENDGIDPGNLFTGFATFVKPVIGDRLALDLTYLIQDQQKDAFEGRMLVPTATGPMVFDRPSFSGGTTQFFGASLIWVPNPLFRVMLSGLANIDEPGLGPAPDNIIRIGFQYTFASGLFRGEQ